MHYHRPAVSEPIREQSSPDRLGSPEPSWLARQIGSPPFYLLFVFVYECVVKKSDSTVVCVVISSLHTDEGVNGDSTVVLEETTPEDLEDFN